MCLSVRYILKYAESPTQGTAALLHRNTVVVQLRECGFNIKDCLLSLLPSASPQAEGQR